MIRIWSAGSYECTGPVLDNARLFPREQHMIERINAVIRRGGRYEDAIEALREIGDDDVANELEEIALSTGSSDPRIFRRYLEKIRKPYVAEELRRIVEALAHNGTSLAAAQATISQLFQFELEIQEGTKAENILYVGDPADVPEHKGPEWRIENVLHSGTTALCGLPKRTKKTLFAITVALSLATGVLVQGLSAAPKTGIAPSFGRVIRGTAVLVRGGRRPNWLR